MERETEHELTLEQRRANASKATAAESAIRALVNRCNIGISKVLIELAGEVDMDINAIGGDWISNCETLQDDLCAEINKQFETM